MESIVSSKDRLHFFEYLEVELMQEYLRTGINYFVNAILNAYPALVRLRYYSLEISTVLDFLKDLICLAKYRGTYAENFFYIDRKPSKNQKFFALKGALVWTIIPYITTKIENYYNEVKAEQIDGKKLSKLKNLFKILYPYVYCLASSIQLLYKFKYIYAEREKEQFYNLLYQINDVHLGHMPRPADSKYPILELFKRPGLLIVLMGHKIVSWYFSNKNSKQLDKLKDQDQREVEAPVREEQVQQEGICPICTEELKNATVVRTTGYVYCYECISEYIQREKKCPMSECTASSASIQVLYN